VAAAMFAGQRRAGFFFFVWPGVFEQLRWDAHGDSRGQGGGGIPKGLYGHRGKTGSGRVLWWPDEVRAIFWSVRIGRGLIGRDWWTRTNSALAE